MTLETRFLPQQLYPMQSHHMREIEAGLRLRSEAGTESLRDALRHVQVTFICFTNRAGSNLFTDFVSQAGFGVRIAQEEFNSSNVLTEAKKHSFQSFDEYLAYVVNTTKRNNTCFWKVGASQLLWIANRGLLSEFMPAAKYIYIRRRDKIAQAVSLYIMNRTGQYLKTIASNQKGELSFDGQTIAKELMWILDSEKIFSFFFTLHNLAALEVWYEDFVISPRACIAEVAMFCGFADQPWINLEAVEVSKSQIKRQASPLNDIFCENMRRQFAIAN